VAIALLAAATCSLGCGKSTRQVFVYFPSGDSCEVQAFPRDVPAGAPVEVVRAALTELIAGPTAEEAAKGLRSAIPDTVEILRHRMRHVVAGDDEPHKGRRVEIQKLEVRPDGILYVSFSPEINAYDHGATRVCAIVRQVQETVRQFPEFKDVMIAVDGKTEGTLQP
jgi:spore germination protein GerM